MALETCIQNAAMPVPGNLPKHRWLERESTNVILRGLALLISFLVANIVKADESLPLLNQIREADEIWLEGSTLSFNLITPLPLTDTGEIEHLQYGGMLTGANGIWAAILMMSAETPPPVFKAPAPPVGNHEVARPNRDTLRVSRITSQIALSGADYWGILYRWAGITVGPNGVVRDNTKSVLVPRGRTEFRSAGTPIDNRCVYIPLLISGRGYSFLIDEITGQRVLDESGFIECTAIGKSPGFGPSGKSFVWQLIIDPEAGYLVRHARCSPASENASAFIEIENSGLHVGSRIALPVRGYLRHLPDVLTNDLARYTATFESLDAQLDKTLLEDARTILFPNMPSDARVFDRAIVD